MSWMQARADIHGTYRMNESGRWEPRFDPAIFPALVEDSQQEGEALYFELEQINAPTLIIRGDRSFIPAVRIDEIAQALAVVQVRTIPRAGHFLIKEKPQEVAQLLREFGISP